MPHSLTKFRLLKDAARRSGVRVFVGAGTYRGVTAARCARIFDRVYTIEYDPKLARDAKEYLRRWPNVEVIEGDALVELPKVLERPDVKDALLFLDGHFSGGDTGKGDLAEPAVEEIAMLARFRSKLKAIVVDDFRCFGTDAGWPTISELLAAFEKHFGVRSDLRVHADQDFWFDRAVA